VARFLFVVPPLVGHTNPTVALGVELGRRGHDVAWVGHREVVPALLPPGARFLPVADAFPSEMLAVLEDRLGTPQSTIAGFRTLWEDFVVPTARHMVPGVQRAVDAFGPDVILADGHALAGVAVAEVRGLPWVTTMTSPADLRDPLAGLPKLGTWLHGQMAGVLVEAGVPPDRAAAVDPRFSPHLLLAFTVPELVPEGGPVPEHCAFVGASVEDRPEDVAFPWGWLDSARRAVLVTLGTVNWRVGERFFAAAIDALADMDVHGVVVAPADLVGRRQPANVLVRERVPQLALLRHVDAVVCHGGHNTVCESLAHGVPLVLASIRDDQPFVAERVAQLGAGIRVRFRRATATELRAALDGVLGDPAYGQAAARVGGALRRAGGPRLAADRLESLLSARATAAGAGGRVAAAGDGAGGHVEGVAR
jgi:UDP:flavonoid glycosyltransferase YjiC (YdhE family)